MHMLQHLQCGKTTISETTLRENNDVPVNQDQATYMKIRTQNLH